MSQVDIEGALAPLREMLGADGYALELRDVSGEFVTAAITAGPDACADCLVPKDIMRTYFLRALEQALPGDPPEVRLVYPGE